MKLNATKTITTFEGKFRTHNLKVEVWLFGAPLGSERYTALGKWCEARGPARLHCSMSDFGRMNGEGKGRRSRKAKRGRGRPTDRPTEIRTETDLVDGGGRTRPIHCRSLRLLWTVVQCETRNADRRSRSLARPRSTSLC